MTAQDTLTDNTALEHSPRMTSTLKKKVYIIQPTFHKMDGKLVKGFSLASCPLELPQMAGAVPLDWEKTFSHEYLEDIDYDSDASVIFITSPSNDILHARDIITQFKLKGKKVIFGAHEDGFSEDILGEVADAFYRGIPDKADVKLMLEDALHDRLKAHYDFGHHFNYPYDYTVYEGKKVNYIHVQGSTGCLFKCEFCRHPSSSNGGVYKLRDINCIIEDLRSVRKLTKYVAFKDPNFYNKRSHLLALCNRIIEEKIDVTWGAQMPIYVGKDKEVLDLMKKAGCRVIYIGFETLNQDNLDYVNKPFQVKDYIPMVRNIQNIGIRVVGYFMFGFDYDTAKSFDAVFDFVHESKIAYPLLNILTPVPGTPVFERMKREGRLDLPDAETFKEIHPLYSIPCNHAYFEPKLISREELESNFMTLSKRLSSLKEVWRRSFSKIDALSLIFLKMNLEFRKDHKRLELLNHC
ncbi:B12-binding domain-containing radical SAM protein [Aestuariivivens sediminicola]|uniref:B12-binding domain-containing radical SAM protein n=1 Tax=Aestuariivivens sediminicola TaxID=2913560 RepID=UPI001F58B95C|nr:radical SAM protein [Aestuariivivens sediminicola]